MKKEKISIIVCAYNTEQYISKCLDSLIHQSYQNLEIIVVNDCSKDATSKILEEYEKKDPRILLFSNKENKGLAYSRNLGLKKASGNYIGFIDSDDYVDQDYYEKLINSIKEERSEIAICDIKSLYEKDGTSLICKGCNKEETEKLSFINVGLAASCCNKLFQKDLFSEDPFEVGKVNEDIAVVIPIMIKAKKISYVPDSYYYYIQRENSIQNSKFSLKKFDIFDGVDHTLQKINSEDKSIKDAIIFNQIILLFCYEITKIKNSKERKKILKQFYDKSFKYDILTNQFLNNFYQKSGKKTGYFYRLLLILEYHKCFNSTNLLISLYQFIKEKIQTIPLQKDTEEKIVLLAKKQAKKKERYPKISVVIPNYNYEKFLIQRVTSILNQKVKIHEIIFLDDHSLDNSRQAIEKLVKQISPYIKFKTKFNSNNSGSAFTQWETGFNLATGDYIWICEADDYCNKNLLKNLIKPIKRNNNIVISYCDTAMIDTFGRILVSSVKNDIDLQKTGHWNHNFINNGQDEIKEYAFLNCTIANVSSAIIKRDNYSNYFMNAKKLKQAGDWMFYIQVMNDGAVAYSKKVCNYYRIHGNNITSVTKKQAHLEEIQTIHNEIEKKYGLNESQKKMIKKRIEFLKKTWNLDIENSGDKL